MPWKRELRRITTLHFAYDRAHKCELLALMRIRLLGSGSERCRVAAVVLAPPSIAYVRNCRSRIQPQA